MGYPITHQGLTLPLHLPSLSSLVQAMLASRKLEEAGKLSQRRLGLCDRVYGKGDPRTAGALMDQVQVLQKQCRWADTRGDEVGRGRGE